MNQEIHRYIIHGQLMLRALEDKLSECAQQGRMEHWRRCTKEIVDYIADGVPPPEATTANWLDWISQPGSPASAAGTLRNDLDSLAGIASIRLRAGSTSALACGTSSVITTTMS